MTADEISEAIAAGADAWANSEDLPPMPKGNEVTLESMFWVGFIKARSLDFFNRRAIALYPDRIEPRP